MDTIGVKFLDPLVVHLKVSLCLEPPIPPHPHPHPPPCPEYRAIFTFQQGNHISQGENLMNTMQAGTAANLKVNWVDAHGNPARVDGATSWQSSDDSIATVQANVDDPKGLGASVSSVGPVGPVQIQATADADLGDGVKSITATCDITVIAGEAAGGEIDFTQDNTVVPNRPRRK